MSGSELARRVESVVDTATGEVVDLTPRVYMGGVPVHSPAEALKVGIDVANELTRIIREKKLYSTIQGKNFVTVEGWTTAAAMLGLSAREESVVEDKETGEFVATVALVRCSDGALIGRASALCGGDEKPWNTRSRNAQRSMAVTRAAGKACRLCLSWIVKVAGFEPTPEEEMPGGGEANGHDVPVVATVNANDKPAPSVKEDAAEDSPDAWKKGLLPEEAMAREDIADQIWDMWKQMNKATTVKTLGEAHKAVRQLLHKRYGADIPRDGYAELKVKTSGDLARFKRLEETKPAKAGAQAG